MNFEAEMQSFLDQMIAGEILPQTIAPDGKPPFWGHWDNHYDFRTNKDHSTNKPRFMQRDGFIVWVVNDTDSHCPSGPCGQTYRMYGAVTPSGWGKFVEMWKDRIPRLCSEFGTITKKYITCSRDEKRDVWKWIDLFDSSGFPVAYTANLK